MALTCPRPLALIAHILWARRLLTASYLLGFFSYFVIIPATSSATRAVIAWDIGSFLYLSISFIQMIRTLERDIREDAKTHQEGEWAVFSIIILGAIMSLASIILFYETGSTHLHKDGFLGIAVITLALSWVLTQTSFAYRYAHEYYSYDQGEADIDGGILFPDDTQPDYLDFIYFSFVLGMTFQVSDCDITSKKLRRLATVQGLIGFLFNTVILALAINVVASSL